jgi:hypothetical protein
VRSRRCLSLEAPIGFWFEGSVVVTIRGKCLSCKGG